MPSISIEAHSWESLRCWVNNGLGQLEMILFIFIGHKIPVGIHCGKTPHKIKGQFKKSLIYRMTLVDVIVVVALQIFAGRSVNVKHLILLCFI